jgi:hypothetical protein
MHNHLKWPPNTPKIVESVWPVVITMRVTPSICGKVTPAPTTTCGEGTTHSGGQGKQVGAQANEGSTYAEPTHPGRIMIEIIGITAEDQGWSCEEHGCGGEEVIQE